MIDLIFDTETTGFALFSEPYEHPDQPHTVQIAARLVENGRLYASFHCIIDCMVESSEGALKVHGITKELSARAGLLPQSAARPFASMLCKADRLVAHNIKFDLLVVGALLYRSREFRAASMLERMLKFCTMLALTPVMKLPTKRGGYKWPKLEEAYVKYIDASGMKDAHDAMADTIACEKLFEVCKELDLVPEGGEL